MNFDFGSFLLGIVAGIVGGIVVGALLVNDMMLRAWDRR